MPSAIKILPHYTYDDYCVWEGRWELIDGIPFAMSPAPSPKHQWVSANLKAELRTGIQKSGCKNCKVYDFIDIKVSENTIIQPDAVVVCNEITKAFLDFPAALIVEILSPATAIKDRNSKFYIYEEQKIPYFIIVDPIKKEIEVYHLKEEGKYQLESLSTAKPYTFQLSPGCSADVILDNIWE